MEWREREDQRVQFPISGRTGSRLRFDQYGTRGEPKIDAVSGGIRSLPNFRQLNHNEPGHGGSPRYEAQHRLVSKRGGGLRLVGD